MREVLIDTETTGPDPGEGHRMIELAGVEVLGGKVLGARYHCYINPEMPMDAGATVVHGITNRFLRNKPVFSQIIDGFLRFIGSAPLADHNARFDVDFINAELSRISYPEVNEERRIIDTLAVCKKLYPGERNNLDALLDRFQISVEDRESFGALLDAELMAEVYIELCKQGVFDR